MPENSKSLNSRTHVDYTPAKLCDGKEWYVYFSAWHPGLGKLKRKKIKINRINPMAERRKYARKMIENINQDLENGWSPWVEQVAARGMHRLTDAINTFLNRKLLEIEPNSKRSYKSLTGYLIRWIHNTGRSEMLAVSWSRQDTTDYLDHLLRERDLSPRTYNNYIIFCRTLFNWLVEREYMAGNPFLKQKKLKVSQKKRLPIPADILFRIQEYLEMNDPGYLMVCYLLFYTEIRPGEQCKLQVSDIDFNRQVILLGGESTKNKKSRYPTIPDVFLKYMRELGIDQANPNHFLISENYLPGRSPSDGKRLSKRWTRLRKELKIPMKYQLYSLRDSGIKFMLKSGVSPDDVMIQSGHADLEMTSEYINQFVREPVDTIKSLGKGF